MEFAVFTKSFDTPKINKKEILRYAGAKNGDNELEKVMEECIAEIMPQLTYKACWSKFPLTTSNGMLDLTFTKTSSKDLAKNLKKAGSVIVFAATVGVGADRLIAKYSSVSALKSLMFQAIGSERVESLCDAFCSEIKCSAPRFSPGYGDLPLKLQRDIFRALEPSRKIGLTLNENLLMSPSKSVTAIIGITD